MLRPQSGNDRGLVYDPQDNWDAYQEKPTRTRSELPEVSPYSNMEPASEESLIKAFATSNASRALSEEMAPFDQGRKHVRAQHKEKTFEQYNPNILPSPAVRPMCVVDEFYLGGLGVQDRSKSGRTFVDRLGTEYDIYESEMPPPDKDYSTIAPNTSQRHLERCQGGDPYFADRPKKEVSDTVNPPEPRGDGGVRRERQNAAELKGRQTFFNKAGMQTIPEMDAERDVMYDGYNIRTDYSKRTYPVENCWRATVLSSNEPGGEPVGPGVKVRSNVHLKRREPTGPFSQTSRGAHASARTTRISLPILQAATLRSQKMNEGTRDAAKFVATGAVPKRTDQYIDHEQGHRKNAGDMEPVRPVAEVARVVDPEINAHGDTEKKYDGNHLGLKAPVEFSSAMADVQKRDQHRENGLIKPAPSRDVEVVKRIAQSIEHDMDDDVEVSEINERVTKSMVMAPMREDVDHPSRMELERPEGSRDAIPVEASSARAEVKVGADDIGVDDARTEGALVRAARAHIDVTRHGHDEIAVDYDRTEGALVRAGQAHSDVTRHGRNDIEYEHDALQQIGETKPLNGKVRVDDMREMCDEGPVERDAAVHSRRVDASARADGADVVRVDETRVDMHYGSVKPAHPRPNVSDKHRSQLVAPEKRNQNVNGHVRVEAWPTVNEERVNAAKRTGQAVGGINSSQFRSDFDSLPMNDRACVAVRARLDRTGTHRMLDGKSDNADSHRTQQFTETIGGGKLASTNARPQTQSDIAPRTEVGSYARTNQPHGEMRRNPVIMNRVAHRDDTARSTSGSMEPQAHGANSNFMAMRMQPTQSNALGGVTKNERLDVKGGASVSGPLLRATVQSNHDRSTPVPRSMTPAMNISNARWTPTLQVESRREQRC